MNGYLAPPPPEEQPATDGALSAPQQDTSADFSRAAQQQQPTQAQPDAPFAPPTYPGMPGVPLSWAAPTAPEYPTAPGYSGAPSAPLSGYAPQPGVTPDQASPSAPAYPVYPGVPSVPLGAPMQGAYPTYPSYPASYPGYAGYPSTPLTPYGAPMTIPLQQQGSLLAQPFPAWLSVALGVAAVALVLVAFSASVLAGNMDWADGARIAGLVAFGVAGIALIVAIVRGAMGRRGASMIVLSAVLVVGLLLVGSTGVFASPQIHGFQASALEGSHDWQGAIKEYSLSGEQAPNAPDIARTLDEQGEQQFAASQYAAAITTFTTVTTKYGQSGDAVSRATTDTFDTYSAWVKSKTNDVPYGDAINFFDQYRSASSCSASCASAAADVEAQALFQYGTSLASQSDYADAVTQFVKLTSDFPSSTFAPQAHTSAATAYLAEGEQEIDSACPSLDPFDASSTSGSDYQALLLVFQTLSTKYSDTPEGIQAKAALVAPQNVSGTVIDAPSGASEVLLLSKHADPTTDDFSADYAAGPDSKGNFTFHNVALGAFNLAGLVGNSSGVTVIWYRDPTTGNLYNFHVFALCPVTGVQFDASVS